MAVTHNLVIRIENEKNPEKPFWKNVGIASLDGDKPWVKLEMLPVGVPGWDGFVKLFPRDKGTANEAARQPSSRQDSGGGTFDDDIPFGPRHYFS